jgi:hypothetical protein
VINLLEIVLYSLNESSTDAEYLAAVERGDMERCQEMVDSAAKVARYTVRAYRGSETDYLPGTGYIFKEADRTYFTPDVEYAKSYRDWNKSDSGALYAVWLRLENPFTPDDINRATDWDYVPELKKLKGTGYDGVLGRIEGEDEVYVVFSPSQIKSADPITYDDSHNPIPLSQRFNHSSNDIRY